MVQNIKQSYRYCRSVTKHASSTFYLASFLCSKDVRQDLYAVYAFCRIADDLADAPGLDDDRRRRELDLLSRTLRTKRYTEDDMLWPAFFDTIERRGIPLHYFDEILKGVMSDIDPHTPKNIQELEHYSYLVAGVVGIVCVYILSSVSPSKSVLEGAKRLGIAMQITNIMRDVSADLAINRIYLPLSLLKKHGLSMDDIKNTTYDERFVALMAELATLANNHYAAARDTIALLEPSAKRPVIIMLRLYQSILERIEQKRYNVYNTRIRLGALSKLGVVISARP